MRREKDPIRLLLTGGGTGGHLFPAIATAQEFQRRLPGTEVLFVGTRRKMDSGSLEAYGFASRSIVSYGVKGKNIVQLLKAVAALPLSYVQAVAILRQFRPDIVFGVGGYVTGPVVAAAKSIGIPTIIHEQNSVPGLANRKLGKIVDRICLSLPGSGQYFPREKTVHTGNPVRKKILDLLTGDHPGKESRKPTMLVLGGSQGASGVNRLVMEAFLSPEYNLSSRLNLIHQTGERDLKMVIDGYKKAGVRVNVKPFFTRMEKVYERADFLVSRAGATTLSEIAVLGKPAVLIPYPYAADDHQTKNAEFYVEGGGAVMYREKDLSGSLLASCIVELVSDKNKLESMGRAMTELSWPDAPEKIVACCLELLKTQQ
jgi:UDP-N-acetylglucosamine--N-acetylmuramyl-(pentapeptide) pyrophosphoryl-undecaprenol N-acetylglucosamine transferase